MRIPGLRLPSFEAVRFTPFAELTAPTLGSHASLATTDFSTIPMVSAWTSTNTMATTSNQFETYASTLDYEDLGQADVYGSVGDFSALELLLAWAPLIDLYGPSYTNFAGRGGHRRAPIIRGLLNLRRKRVYRTHKNKGRKLAGAPRSIHCANGSCENGAVVRESTGAMTIWSANAPPAVPGGG